METALVFQKSRNSNYRSYRTYEEWKHLLNTSYALQQQSVLTVPMRNGNTNWQAADAVSKGSYRTYEEWKLASHTASATVCISSYRTYEEWKPTSGSLSFFTIIVLTVPMRNGNLGQ